MSATLNSHRLYSQSKWGQSLGLCIGLMALLSACAQTPQVVVDQSQEAVQYQAHAARHYEPPGPPKDPWGPYIVQAAERFDVPIEWVRAVMKVESGGRLYEFGTLITSPAGAMGLMQVMPETYDGLRQRYALSDDAYDPLNNILAGTAYIREMYDIYGSPAFLAAYNAGPARLDDYLNNRRGLPDETRHYVAKAGPYVVGIFPARRSSADELAFNQLPLDIPVGLRYPRPRIETRVAQSTPSKKSSANAMARNGHGQHPAERPVEVAQLPEPPQMPSHGATDPHPSPSAKIRLVAQAVPANAPAHHDMPVPPVAVSNAYDAHHPADKEHGEAKIALSQPHSVAGVGKSPHGSPVRARLIGLTKEAPTGICAKPAAGHAACLVLSSNAHL